MFIADQDDVLSNAAPAPEPAPAPADTHGNRTSAAATAGYAGIPHSTPDDRRSTKKNFLAMALAPSVLPVFPWFLRLRRCLYRRL